MPMQMSALVCAMVLLFTLSSHALANGRSRFEQASQAFVAGQYSQAIDLFKQAEQQGYNPQVIAYNLGVSYFKLGDYKNAEQAFLKAVKSQKLRQLVEYNIGLVYNKLGHAAAAQNWFRAAANPQRYGKYYNKKIGALALYQLPQQKSTASRNDQVLSRLEGAIQLAYGYDDDVTSVPTGTDTFNSDHFVETFAYLKLKLDFIHFRFSFYEQNYSKVDSSDFDTQEFSISYPIKSSYGRFTPSLHYFTNNLDHRDYQDIYDFRLAYRYVFNRNNTLKLRYRYSNINSQDSLYDYLEGNRQQLRIEELLHTAFGRVRLRYEYETNDRQDLISDNYSPTRHTLQLQLKNSFAWGLKMTNQLGYRISTYEAAQISGNSFVREDERLRYQLRLYHEVMDNLELGLQYQRTDNISNDANRDYRKNVYQAYLYWYF